MNEDDDDDEGDEGDENDDDARRRREARVLFTRLHVTLSLVHAGGGVRPSSVSSRSPTRSPARSAGLPGSTPVTTQSSKSRPRGSAAALRTCHVQEAWELAATTARVTVTTTVTTAVAVTVTTATRRSDKST